MTSGPVSVIVHFTSADENCSRCITSILEQTYPDIEVVVVGAKKPTLSSIEPSKYTYVRLDCDPGNINELFNKTAGYLQGKYALYLNSDSWIFPGCVEQLVIEIEKSSRSMLVVGYYLMKLKSAVIRIPDENDIPFVGRFPFFFTISEFRNSSDFQNLDRSSVGIVKDLLFCSECIEKQPSHILSEVYFFGRRMLFNLVNCKVIWDNSKKIKSLKGAFAGKRLFIVGNGPSLTVEDLEKLKGEYTFAANGIINMYGKTSWRPTFFIISDVLAMENLFKNLPSSEAEYSFFKLDYKKYLEKGKEKNPILYRSRSAFFDNYPPNFSEDPSRCVYCSATVSYLSLQLAFYFGFTDIYLLGMDHTYPLQRTKKGLQLRSVSNHCYQEPRKDGDECYFAGLDVVEDSFVYCKGIAEKRGIRVYNATRGGELEIFERIDFDSLFD